MTALTGIPSLRGRSWCRALLLGSALVGCHPSQPGFGPLLVPLAPLVPEATRCGTIGDPLRRSPIDAAIFGAADFHNHQFADIGFGGRLLWGRSFDPGGIEPALSSCGAEGLCLDEREAAICSNLVCAVSSEPDECRASCEAKRCTSPLPHGHFGDTDPVGLALGQGVGHSVHGFPLFEGWPHWSTYTHQQVYHRWLRRAFDGGMKLMVMQAVSNEVLCEFLGHEHACDDMTNVDLQIQAANDLEAYVDEQDDCDGTNHSGWYRIAYTPAQARKIISEGGMAVVLGIEVDTLFGCYKDRGCTKENIRSKIDRYYELGVRHVFPMHVFDNAFGGAAAYGDFFNFGNVVVNRSLLGVRDCSREGYEFRFGDATSEITDLLSAMAATLGVRYDSYPAKGAHCNAQGLTPFGEVAIGALMDRKMIIDVDHMSARSRKGVLDLAAARRYPGLVSGHSGFTDLYAAEKKSEGQLTRDEVRRLVALGGLLAPILHQGSREQLLQYHSRATGTKVADDCGSSSKSFAQAYLYAADASGGRGVGFGSDFNGLAGMPRPRFGRFACGGDIGAEQTNRVRYPVSVHGDVGDLLPRSQAGNRVFDINVDGFAHVGMFPDFVADLRAIGLTDEDLRPLFTSAEAYISMWECVEDPAHPGCRREPAPAASSLAP